MATDNQNKVNDFNGKNERAAMDREFQEEHDNQKDEFSKTENDLSLGNSIRNVADVNGTTFGPDSNPAKFSHIGGKDQPVEGSNNTASGE